MADKSIILAGMSNSTLADLIAQYTGITLGNCTIERFPDGEINVCIEDSVCGAEVFIVQSTSPPVNDNLIELLTLTDACRRALAKRVTAIIPYFGYSRSDKRLNYQVPIAAKVVADLLQTVGINHVITINIHSPQIEGFFQMPMSNLNAVPEIYSILRDKLPQDVLIVSPDAGRSQMASEFAQYLGTSLVTLHKRRINTSEMEINLLIGEVRDRTCLIVDDMIVSGSTIIKSKNALFEAGANQNIIVVSVHGLFLNNTLETLISNELHNIYTTDTVARTKDLTQLEIISVAPLIANFLRKLS